MKKIITIALLFIAFTSFKKSETPVYTQYWVISAHLVYDDIPNCNKWLVSNIATKETKDCHPKEGIDESYIKYYVDRYKSKCGLREIYTNSFTSAAEAEAYRIKVIKDFEAKNREVFLTDGFVIPCQ